eukprot:Nk52_evm2s359 gene=Nk52_evmTU2s359
MKENMDLSKAMRRKLQRESGDYEHKFLQGLAESHEDLKDITEKILVQRRFIVDEIVKTEKSYLSTLRMIVKKFLEPCRNGKNGKCMIPSEKAKLIFSDIETIEKVNLSFLNDLERVIEGWKIAAELSERDAKQGVHKDLIETREFQLCVGEVFEKHASAFKMYTSYVVNYPHAIEVLGQVEKSSSAFRDLLKANKADPECCALGLPELLHTPIQRIPRYELLLETLHKNTPEWHRDCESSSKAWNSVRILSNHFNEAQREAELRVHMLSLKTAIKDCPNIFDCPSRKLLSSLHFTAVKYKENSLKPEEVEVVCYMFSDMVLFAKVNEDQSSFSHAISFSQIEIEDITATSESGTSECHGKSLIHYIIREDLTKGDKRNRSLKPAKRKGKAKVAPFDFVLLIILSGLVHTQKYSGSVYVCLLTEYGQGITIDNVNCY